MVGTDKKCRNLWGVRVKKRGRWIMVQVSKKDIAFYIRDQSTASALEALHHCLTSVESN
jgi:hypothetical protein